MPDIDQVTAWLTKPVPENVRYGQHLMITAPRHISNAATHDGRFDCWERKKRHDPVVDNFIMFAFLCWDVTDPEELEKAKELVFSYGGHSSV